MIAAQEYGLIRIFDNEMMQIEAWGEDSLRVRVTKRNCFTEENWALLAPKKIIPEIKIYTVDADKSAQNLNANTVEVKEGDSAEIRNGKICLRILENGKLVFLNDRDEILLAEYEYARKSSLKIESRELKGRNGSFRASLKFHASPEEKLFGMGQYQNGIFDLKGSHLELAQRNSQVSVPFVYSSKGYGFLWNNPAVGRVSFGTNMTEWEASSTQVIDFWITAGDSPAEILSKYMTATGKPPVMPEYGLGFWQSKLRYQTQEELMTVAREYHRRGISIDVIVADFFHWTVEGAWAFDPADWPDPKAMVDELKEMGIRLMVSVWPTVSIRAPKYKEMRDRGYLVKSENGVPISMVMADSTVFVDFTNPEAREYLWNVIKENYVAYGVKDFWLDVAEPEFSSYDFENYRYYKGNTAEVGNEYPAMYTKTFFDGLKAEGENPINLVRCAWAGSQKYGALVWSGDIPSTFESLKFQIVCGMQMAMAGIPWWTTDIGGFHGGNIEDPEFRELLIRWFQFGTFCPVMRLHGNRMPSKPRISGRMGSGADNEIWSFGQNNYEIMKKHIEIREKLRPYLRTLMRKSNESGEAVMRPMFYDFPEDANVWDVEDQFMLGEALMVAPVTDYNQRSRNVYLPAGTQWLSTTDGKQYCGGQWIVEDAPIEKIPVFVRKDRGDLVECFR